MALKTIDYFSLPELPWMIAILFGMYLLFGSTFLPSVVPFDYLGPLGSLCNFLMANYPSVLMFLVLFTVLSHSVEAYFCMQMCKRRNISESSKVKWLLSTLVFGGASLYKLSQYKQGGEAKPTNLKIK